MLDEIDNDIINQYDTVSTVDQSDKIKNFFDIPDFAGLICDHVTAGGTLTALCKFYEIEYYLVVNRINKDEILKSDYQTALNYRREHFAEIVLDELKELATFNLAEMFDEKGDALPFHKLPKSLQKAVTCIDFKNNKITFINRLKAIETLARTTNLLNIKVTHEAGQSLEDLIGESFKALPASEDNND